MLATLAAAISSTSPNAAMTMLAPLSMVRRATGSDRAAAGSTISDVVRPGLLLIDAAGDHREIRPNLRELSHRRARRPISVSQLTCGFS